MALDLSAGALLNAASGLLLAAFGLYVATRVPRRRANVVFGVFAAGFGLALVPNNIVPIFDPAWRNPVFLGVYAGVLVVAAVALVAFGLTVPRRLDRGGRRLVVPSLVPGVVVGAALTVAYRSRFDAAAPFLIAQGVPPDQVDAALLAGFSSTFPIWLVFAAYFFVLFLLALRFRAVVRDGTPVQRDQVALFSAALVLWPAAALAASAVPNPVIPSWGPAVGLGLVVLLSVLWLVNTARASNAAAARTARNLALLGPLVILLGMATTMAWARWIDPTFYFVTSPAYGISRTVSVLVLGYGLLRHQLFGIDLKVKWSIKQSTLAAIFLAVIFAVSEGAQALFEGVVGDETGILLGIGAGALLLFALAPVQRFAERVSDVAMPGVKAPDEMTDDERLGLYRRQVEIAWNDGTLSANERLMLKDLREQLGLSAEVAERVDTEVAARETAAGGGAA